MWKCMPNRIVTVFTETFGLGRAAALRAVLLIGLVALLAGFSFVKSAPPDTITITSGPEGSISQTNAEKYKVILARNHVTLRILPSRGSFENLQRLENASLRVDVGFVQGGVTNGVHLEILVSLGSISRWYRALLLLERDMFTPSAPKQEDLLRRLEG